MRLPCNHRPGGGTIALPATPRRHAREPTIDDAARRKFPLPSTPTPRTAPPRIPGAPVIPRRILSHLREQDWVAIAIDLIIVVVGVFIGIQVSNLNQARIDRALAAEYMDRIVADLDTITTTADNQLRFERSKSGQVVAALALLRQAPSGTRDLRLGTVLNAMTTRLSPNYESPTFSDLQNSGRLNLIRDVALRNRLSGYFARLQYLRAAIRLNNDSFAESMVDFLRREGIGAGWADPAVMQGVPLSTLDQQIGALSRQRFGTRDVAAGGSRLRLPAADPFWERLRASITWRGTGAVANERILNLIVADAAEMKRQVGADLSRAAD